MGQSHSNYIMSRTLVALSSVVRTRDGISDAVIFHGRDDSVFFFFKRVNTLSPSTENENNYFVCINFADYCSKF